jgi:predicted nucleotidyltransferase
MISFRSELRRNVLTFFFVNRSARVYVRQLAAALGADSTNVSRELARLEREGFLRAEREGRQLYYTVNRDYPYLKPVFALLRGSVGIMPALKRAIEKVNDIEQAWIYGSFAKGEADGKSDIDLLIVGSPDQTQLAAEIRKTEQALRREINYTVLAPQELNRRLAARDAFLVDVWNGERIEITGHGDDETTTGESGAGEAVSRRRAKEGRSGTEKPEHR